MNDPSSDVTPVVSALRGRIADLEAALTAIREGGIDAVVVHDEGAPRLYALTSADRPYRVIVDNMGEGAATVSSEGIILYVNRQLCRLLGSTRAELVGRNLDSVVSGGRHSRFRQLFNVAAGGIARAEIALPKAGGGYTPVLATVTGLDVEGVALRCLIVTDLSSAKAAERRLVDAERAAAEAEQHRKISWQLQRRLLPPALPRMSSLRLAAAYEPAGGHFSVGGDWYDVIEVHNGQVCLVIGDVVGHSIESAAIMGRLQTTLRTHLLDAVPPHEALRRVNATVVELGPEVIATVAVVLVDPHRRRLRYSNAGHPAPLIRPVNGQAYELPGDHDPFLGAISNARFREHHGQLNPGDAIFLYTDGLIERRRTTLTEGVQTVLGALAADFLNPDRLVRRVLAAADTQLGSDREDDLAVLVAHLDGN